MEPNPVSRVAVCARDFGRECWFPSRNRTAQVAPGLILLIILIVLLLGGFSGRFRGYGYGYGHRGIGVIGLVVIILVVLLLTDRL
jgi:hypothetical protein